MKYWMFNMSEYIEVKVVPSSGRSECFIDENGFIKCFLKSAPEKGKANKELIMRIAYYLKVSKQLVCLAAGKALRHKLIKIETTLSKDEILSMFPKKVAEEK